jgi:hypothetical protein
LGHEPASVIIRLAAQAPRRLRPLSSNVRLHNPSLALKRLFPKEQTFEKDGALHTAWLSLPLTPQGRVSGVAVDPETQRQSESKAQGVVGNEAFWPKK